MTRAPLDYSAPREGGKWEGFDPDQPITGHYKMRIRSGAVYVGIRLWFGPPLDPIDGTELDRATRWNCTANGAAIDLDRVWPKCAGDPITEAEHDYLAGVQAWGEANAPDSPQANPHKRVDFLTAPLPF
jgi:hypothetical protein